MSKAAFIRSLITPAIWLSVRDLFEMAVYDNENINYCDVVMVIFLMNKNGLLERRSNQYRLKSCQT